MVMSIDPGFRKNAIAIVDNKKVLYGDLVINNDDKFGDLKNRILELIDRFSPEVITYEKYSKYYNKKSAKNKKKDKEFYIQYANNFNKYLLPFFNYLNKEKNVEVYYTIASTRNILENIPGWRQRFTGLTFPNEKDVLNELKNLIKSGELEVPEAFLLNNLDIVDAIGIAVTSNKYPEVFFEN
jgi:Holliday junction resolvasome RuvABC endonuclease subunit